MNKLLFFLAYKSFKKDWKSAVFTVLGITVAVFFIFTIRGIGKGVIERATAQFENFGDRYVFLIPFRFSFGSQVSAFSVYFKESEIKPVFSLPFVKNKAEVVFGREEVCYSEKCVYASVYGVEKSMFDMYKEQLKLKQGRFFSNNEKGVAVVGGKVGELFDKEIRVGKSLYINGKKFRVIGIIRPFGSSFSQTDDFAIYINLKDGEEITGKDGLRDFVILEVVKGYSLEEAESKIEEIIRRRRGLNNKDKDFEVLTSAFLKKTIENTLNTITLGVFLISGIALVVSMFGITNTMLEAAVRRKKQIAILKSLGMKNFNAAMLYVMESVIMVLSGFFMGMILSLIFSVVLSDFIEILIGVDDFLLGFGVSLFAGFLGALYPAFYVYKMNIVEALRD